MFEDVSVDRSRGRTGARQAVKAAVLAGAVLFFNWGHHYFLSAFAIGIGAVFFRRARWLIPAACVTLGLGIGLTPRRPEFAGWGDIANAAVVLSGLALATIVCLCFRRTRRTGLWLLLGLALLTVSCYGTEAIRRAQHDSTLP